MYKYTDTTIFLADTFAGEKTITDSNIILNAFIDSFALMCFEVRPIANVDLSKISWKPRLYNLAVDSKDTLYIVPKFIFNDSLFQKNRAVAVNKNVPYVIKPFFDWIDQTKSTGSLLFTLRNPQKILNKVSLNFSGGTLLNASDLAEPIDLPNDDLLYVSYEKPDSNIQKNIKNANYIVDFTDDKSASIGGEPGEQWIVPADGDYIITYRLKFKNPTTDWMNYRLKGAVTKTDTLRFNNTQSNLSATDTLRNLAAGSAINVSYYKNIPHPELLIAKIESGEFLISPIIKADLWGNRSDKKFGPMYRGWGQFIYNGSNNRCANDINENLLTLTPANLGQSDVNSINSNISTQVTSVPPASDNPAPITPAIIPSQIDNLSPMNGAFSVMLPYATKNKLYWTGADSFIYIDNNSLSSSRIGLKDVTLKSPFFGTPIGDFGAIGIEKRSHSTSVSVTAGYGVNASYATGSSQTESDFFDMNGDKFPDIVAENYVQYSKPTGGLGSSKFIGAHYQQSDNHSIGATSEGAFPTSNSTQTSSNKESAMQSAKGANDNIGISGSISKGSDIVKTFWLDYNGDGLPDKITKNGNNITVYLNLGQEFSGPIDLTTQTNDISNGTSITVSPGLNLGFNINNRSISGGMGASLTHSTPDFSFQDMNGDGLVDKVRMDDDGKIWVAINTGFAFQSEVLWLDIHPSSGGMAGIPGLGAGMKKWNSAFSSSKGQSLGGTFTFDIPLPIPTIFTWLVKLSFSAGFNHSMGLGTTTKEIVDFDGDGFPDFLSSDKEGSLQVKTSTIGATNKLQTVTRPLGGTFTINYQHLDVTYNHPGGKWVMSKVEVNDGVPEDGNNKIDSFYYSGGKYDRYEREFLGFNKIVTYNMNNDVHPSVVYRCHTQLFDVSNYYTAGNLINEWIEDNNGNKYSETINQYNLDMVLPGLRDQYAHWPIPDLRFYNGICFSALASLQKGNREGSNNVFVGNYSLYKYDQYGNVIDYYYSDKTMPTETRYGYHTKITLGGYDLTTNIFGLPVNAIIDTLAEGVPVAIRRENANYNGNGKLILEQKQLNLLGHDAVTTFKYDQFGNVTFKQMPENDLNQRMKYYYNYDQETNTYITKTSQSEGNNNFDFSSTMTVDHRFGLPKEIQDIHGQIIKYSHDAFGRTVRIKGPKQSEIDTFTIKYDYYLNGNEPAGYAVTTHYDLGNEGIKTINFVDGFNRSIQVKKNAVASNNNLANWVVSGRVNYDALGRPVESYYPTLDNTVDGLTFIFTTSSVLPTKNSYDILDRTTKVILPDQQVYSATKYSIGSNCLLQTINYNNPVSLKGNGNQLHEIFTDGSQLKVKETSNGIATIYHYDPIHQLSSISDNVGNIVFSHKYDNAGRKIETKNLDGGATKYVYDNAYNLTYKINANGDSINYQFTFNRLTGIHHSKYSNNDVKYVYGNNNERDPNGRECRGRIIYQEDASGAQSFEYDELGNITKNVRTIISPFDSKNYTFITQYNYDTWNRTTGIIYPSGDTVNYSYNKAGLLNKVFSSRESYINAIGYDEFEQRVSIQYGNNTAAKYSYNSKRRRLDSVATSKTTTRVNLSSFAYDNLDNIVAGTDVSTNNLVTNAKISHSYKYDIQNRLLSSTDNWDDLSAANNDIINQLTLTYDDLYNVKTKKIAYKSGSITRNSNSVFSYDIHKLTTLSENSIRTNTKYKDDDGVRSIKYTQQSQEKYSYDNDGNNLERYTSDTFGKNVVNNVKCRKIIWDEENRIKSIDIDGAVSSYIYDADGNRTIKISTESQGIYTNGRKAGDSTEAATFCLYANAYSSMRNGDGVYSQHIYIGSERIVSELVNDAYLTTNVVFPPPTQRVASCDKDYNPNLNEYVNTDFGKKTISANGDINSYFKKFGRPYRPIAANAFSVKPELTYPNITNPYRQGENTAMVAPSATSNKAVTYYYHSNYLGSTSFITNKNGDVVQYLEYLPFGETFAEARNDYSSQYMFNGKEQDQETGLYYYGARYYDPHTYQWLGVDPVGEYYPTISPYNYCLNNPVKMKDPDGKFSLNFGGNLGVGALAKHSEESGWVIGTSKNESNLFNTLTTYNTSSNGIAANSPSAGIGISIGVSQGDIENFAGKSDNANVTFTVPIINLGVGISVGKDDAENKNISISAGIGVGGLLPLEIGYMRNTTEIESIPYDKSNLYKTDYLYKPDYNALLKNKAQPNLPTCNPTIDQPQMKQAE